MGKSPLTQILVLKRMKYVFVGNSHLDKFCLKDNEFINYDILYARGASIKGLLNKNSTTGLNQQIFNYENNNNNFIFCFHLGQVDIEFGYYYKCVKENTILNPVEFIDKIVEIYEIFLKSLKTEIIVIGLHPSVIINLEHIFHVNFNDQMCHQTNFIEETGELQNITFNSVEKLYKTVEDLQKNVKLCNEKIKEMCLKNNFKFIDLFILLEESNGKCKREYLPNNLDHHIIPHKSILEYIIKQF